MPVPPPQAPVLTVFGRSFQGVNNTDVTLAVSDLDPIDLAGPSCTVKGGYPEAGVAHVGCEWEHELSDNNNNSSSSGKSLDTSSSGKTSRLFCSCRADHVSGCYSNNKTKVTFIVQTIQHETTTPSKKPVAVSTSPQTTKSTKLTVGETETSRGGQDSKNSGHTKLLYIFIVISIIAIVIILVLVIVIVAVTYRKKKRYSVAERGDSNRIIFSEISSTQ
ncbi:hypothetical protein ElyMa_000214200 [Elysia marginata]|uniref:IPT/TIG domain-containing protein n=1 Tax=Elysia marginata TaxID=1093978 RepID=A0AAV4F0F2_9GAST|nr:hypothetical protein ElyMa_000214200 [Elysia marginata]